MLALRLAWQEYVASGGPLLAAAVAYFNFLSIFPVTILAVVTGSVITGRGAGVASIQARIAAGINELIPGAGAILESVARNTRDAAATFGVIGLLTLAWASTTGFSVLQRALSRMWGFGIQRTLWVERLIAVALVAAAAAVMGVILLADAGLDELQRQTDLLGPRATLVRRGVELVIGLALGAALVTALFLNLSRGRIKWWPALGGAVLVAALWGLVILLFGAYVRYVGPYARVYGPIATFVAILAFNLLASQALLLGAKYAKVLGRTDPLLPEADEAPQEGVGIAG